MCTHINTHNLVHTNIDACTQTHSCTHTCIRKQILMQRFIHSYRVTHIYTFTHILTFMYMPNTHIYTHPYIYSHMYYSHKCAFTSIYLLMCTHVPSFRNKLGIRNKATVCTFSTLSLIQNLALQATGVFPPKYKQISNKYNPQRARSNRKTPYK